jgi:hypothetical protein
VATSWFLHREHEPRYKGRRLSRWLALYSDSLATESLGKRQEAEHAVRQIGTNAIPNLLKWLQFESSSQRAALFQKLPKPMQTNMVETHVKVLAPRPPLGRLGRTESVPA